MPPPTGSIRRQRAPDRPLRPINSRQDRLASVRVGYRISDPESGEPVFDDDAEFVPRWIVVDSELLKGATTPETPLETTVIYEAHVKGLTTLHPEVPAERGEHARAPLVPSSSSVFGRSG